MREIRAAGAGVCTLVGACFAFGLLVTATADAQRMPGRDLFEFPVGTIAEAPVLATLSRDGVWNPAATIVDQGRARLVVSALDAPSEQGVGIQLLAAAVSLGRFTLGTSVVRAGISGIPRTEDDPQSVGPDVPYNATLVSLSLARRLSRSLDGGLAMRFHRGQLDQEVRVAVGFDAGIVVRKESLRDLRVAFSTFMLHPGIGSGSGGDSRFSTAADVRLLGRADTLQLRAGVSYSYARVMGTEGYGFVTGRWSAVELNVGVVRSDLHGFTSTRPRIGIGVRARNLTVGLAREDNQAGIAPAYQVVLGTRIR